MVSGLCRNPLNVQFRGFTPNAQHLFSTHKTGILPCFLFPAHSQHFFLHPLHPPAVCMVSKHLIFFPCLPFQSPLEKENAVFFFFSLCILMGHCAWIMHHRAPSLLQGLAGQPAACEVSYQATWQNSTLSALCSAIERVTPWPLPSTQKTPNYLICWPALDLQSTQPGTILKRKKRHAIPFRLIVLQKAPVSSQK